MADSPDFNATCPNCSAVYPISVSDAGRLARCAACQADFLLPEAPLPAPPAASRAGAVFRSFILVLSGAGLVWGVATIVRTQRANELLQNEIVADVESVPPAAASIAREVGEESRETPLIEPEPVNTELGTALPRAETALAPPQPPETSVAPPTPVVPDGAKEAPAAAPPSAMPDEATPTELAASAEVAPAIVSAPAVAEMASPPAPAVPVEIAASASPPPMAELATAPAGPPMPLVPVPAAPVIAKPVPLAANDLVRLRQNSRVTLERFLRAGNIDERLAFSQNPDLVRAAMEQHYRKWPDGPQAVEEISFLTEGEVPESRRKFHLYNVVLKDEPSPIPLALEQTKDGFRVDWPTFAESYTHALRTFFAAPVEGVGRFRVMLRRAHYFGTPVPGQGTERIAFTIEPPMRDETFFIWADTDSIVYQEKLAAGQRATWDAQSYVIVELMWKGDAKRGRWVGLHRIPADSWRADP